MNTFILGVDEVGRGPLVGSVYAGAVLVPSDWQLDGLKDSKQLSAKQRVSINKQLLSDARVISSLAAVSAEVIDEVNILQASFLAMRRAVLELLYKLVEDANLARAGSLVEAGNRVGAGLPPERIKIIIDGNKIPTNLEQYIKQMFGYLTLDLQTNQTNLAANSELNLAPKYEFEIQAVIQADKKIPAVAAAAVLAKVARDREMALLAERYPGYGFEQHQGYPTAQHLQALTKLGPIPHWHRFSYKPVQQSYARQT